MGKYVIHQQTQSGHIVASVGDHQHVTITVTDGKKTLPPVTPGQPEHYCKMTGDETIIAPVGGESQIYVNGKRIQ